MVGDDYTESVSSVSKESGEDVATETGVLAGMYVVDV